nr:hypothetical protein [Tanacetum cinerariifolium]
MKRAQSIYRDEHTGVAFCQKDAWAILKFHPKWDAPEQVDLTGDVSGDTHEDLFGHDARPRPAGKPRPAKKTKSDATASTGGNLEIHGLGLVIVAIEKKLVVVLVGVVETVPVSSTRIG